LVILNVICSSFFFGRKEKNQIGRRFEFLGGHFYKSRIVHLQKRQYLKKYILNFSFLPPFLFQYESSIKISQIFKMVADFKMAKNWFFDQNSISFELLNKFVEGYNFASFIEEMFFVRFKMAAENENLFTYGIWGKH
jgi:hypothetical protein